MPRTKLSDADEVRFRDWYRRHATRMRINPDPDDPRHYYDYRKAYLSGHEPDSSGHWPSEHKDEEHPRRVVEGKDTATGEKVDDDDYTGPLRKKKK